MSRQGPGRAPGFDWPALLRLGVCRLGLRPAEFWALTPAELRLMLGEVPGTGPLDRSALASLMARFPDTRKDTSDDHRDRGAGRTGDGAGGEP